MQLSSNHKEPEELKIIANSDAQKTVKKSKIVSQINKFWQLFIDVLTRTPELKVWQQSRRGNTYWTAYNPFTGRYASFGSSAEMLNWIEESYRDRY